MKNCSKCKLPKTNFKPKTNICKECISAYNTAYLKSYYKNKKEKILLQQKEYYENHKSEIIARQKEYAQQNPDVNKRATAKYRKTENGKAIGNARTRNYRARKHLAQG